jgi:hypothetical protein
MLEHKARVLPGLSREPVVKSAADGSERLALGQVGLRLLEPASTQARNLEGRPVDMYDSLMLPDRSRLRLK